MNYFTQFLESLDPVEVARIETAHLTPTERKVFEFISSNSEAKDMTDKVESFLSLSHNTYYKNCSNLLAKSYDTLVPDGGVDLLFFLLKKKFLIANGIRELKKQEKIDVKKMDAKEKQRFYFGVFHLLRSVEKIEIQMSDFRTYGRKVIASRLKPHPDDARAIKIYLEQRQFTKDLKQTTKRFSVKYITKYFSSLQAHKKALAKNKNAFAHFNFHAAAYNYYYNTHMTPERMGEHLQGLLKWLPAELEAIFPWVRPARELDAGTIYVLAGDYEKGFQFYQKNFHDGIIDYVTLRVPMDYFMTAVYTDHHEIAENLIFKIHGKDLQKPLENSRTSVAANMWLAILYFNWEKFENARTYLNSAFRLNQKGSYSRYNESILRAIEICYYFFMKDWNYVEQLIARYRQWLRRNEFKDPNSSEIVFIDIAGNYLDHIFGEKPLSEDLENRKREVFGTEVSGIIGKFLNKMKETAIAYKY